MIPVHIYFTDGDDMLTRICGTQDDAIRHYALNDALSPEDSPRIARLYFPATGETYTFPANKEAPATAATVSKAQ